MGVQLDSHHRLNGLATIEGPGFDTKTSVAVSKRKGEEKWRGICGEWTEVKSGFYTYTTTIEDSYVKLRFFTRPKKGYEPKSPPSYDVDHVILNVESDVLVQGGSNAPNGQVDRERGDLMIDIEALVKGEDDSVAATIGVKP